MRAHDGRGAEEKRRARRSLFLVDTDASDTERRPIASHVITTERAHQDLAGPLAQAKIHLEHARLLAQNAAWTIDDGLDAGEAANMAKYAAAEAALAALDEAIEVYGGSGLSSEVGRADLRGVARLYRIGPVASEMILNHIAECSLGVPRVVLSGGAARDEPPMHQLSNLDAQFLAMESSNVYGHVGGLLIFDPSTAPGGKLRVEDVSALIEERLHLLPPFRWRLVQAPFDLDHPYWCEDPEFDLGFHVRETAVSPPGDDRQLAETVGRIWGRPLDRAHPMWEVYVVQGLRNGRVGLLIKMHHAAVDGLAYEHILDTLLDSSPEGRQVTPPVDNTTPEPLPGDLAMLARGVLGLPRVALRARRSMPDALPNETDVFGANTIPGHSALSRGSSHLQRLAGRREDDAILEITTSKPPSTRFNGRISPHRRYAFGSLPFDRVKAIKNALGVTVNDVVVTLAATAVRSWLLDQDDLPDDPLVAMVPVAVRSEEESAAFGKRIGMMFAPIPTDEPDARHRLMRSHGVMRSAKEHHDALPADLLGDAAALVPPALASRTLRTLTGLMGRTSRPPVNLILSNVPGPRSWRYSAGARMVGGDSVSLVLDAVGLSITVISYRDQLDFAILVDGEQIEVPWALLNHLHKALAELEGVVGAASPPRGPGERDTGASEAPATS